MDGGKVKLVLLSGVVGLTFGTMADVLTFDLTAGKQNTQEIKTEIAKLTTSVNHMANEVSKLANSDRETLQVVAKHQQQLKDHEKRFERAGI